MHYYMVPRTGEGTGFSPYRPDIPQQVDYMGAEIGNYFLIGVVTPLPSAFNDYKLNEAQLKEETTIHGIPLETVLGWSFSEGGEGEWR